MDNDILAQVLTEEEISGINNFNYMTIIHRLAKKVVRLEEQNHWGGIAHDEVKRERDGVKALAEMQTTTLREVNEEAAQYRRERDDARHDARQLETRVNELEAELEAEMFFTCQVCGVRRDASTYAGGQPLPDGSYVFYCCYCSKIRLSLAKEEK